MRVGLLGLQGAVQDHIVHLNRLGVESVIVKNRDILGSVDRLILPGGESTVMKKFLEQFNMVPALQKMCSMKVPVWGICAGAILLAASVDGKPGVIGRADIQVKRNAYGRQVNSKIVHINIPGLGMDDYQAVFIRAPIITGNGKKVSVLARYGHNPVFLMQDNMMMTTFHPELMDDGCFHEHFLNL